MLFRSEYRKEFQLPDWNEEIKHRILLYWQSRRFSFIDTDGDEFKAKRGSMIGNLTSFDMSKLMAELSVIREHDNTCSVMMTVNTIFQTVTACNLAFWELELDTFESLMLHNDNREEDWMALSKTYKHAALLWALTFGICGRDDLPEDWKSNKNQ